MSGFREAVEAVLDHGGIKGYNSALREICRNLPHALGEIVYKVVRYHAKRDPQDLVKIAAWAKLEWDYANGKGSGAGDTEEPGPARPAYEGLLTSITHSRQGDFGSDSRGARRDQFTEALPGTVDGYWKPEGRTGPGRRGRVAVGSKSRRRKVTG